MRRAILSLLSALAAGPAVADTGAVFRAEVLADDVGRVVSPAPVLDLVELTETIRRAGAQAGGIEALAASQEERAVLSRFFGETTGADGALVRAFFAGAGAEVGPVRAGWAHSGWYNPVADLWLLAGWRREAGAWILTSLSAVDGQAFRNASEPTWTEARDLALPLALARQAGGSLAGFRRGARAQSDAARVEQALRRLHAMSSAADRLGDGAWKKAIGTLTDRFARGEVAGLSKVSSAAPLTSFDALPDGVRRSLRLQAAVQGAGGPTLLLASPSAPYLLILADYEVADGRPRLVGLVSVDAAQAARTAAETPK